MANWPAPQPSVRRIGAIDRFCMLTYQTSAEAARYARGIVPTMGFLCIVLVLSLGVTAWRANAMEQERDRLVEALRSERAARVDATLAAKGVEMNVATFALDTRVRRDLVDERMLQQERRSSQLDQLAQRVEQERLVKADCVTPQSIIASGL
jgi:hypothetical protein